MLAILDFWIFQESVEIEPKVIKTNTKTLFWVKNIKISGKQVNFIHFCKKEILFCEKKCLSKIGCYGNNKLYEH